jgi:hypothetical protein
VRLVLCLRRQRVCASRNLPVEAVQIDDDDLLDLDLGWSVYSKGTWLEWILVTGLWEQAREALIDEVGWSLVLMIRLVGPVVAFVF